MRRTGYRRTAGRERSVALAQVDVRARSPGHRQVQVAVPVEVRRLHLVPAAVEHHHAVEEQPAAQSFEEQRLGAGRAAKRSTTVSSCS